MGILGIIPARYGSTRLPGKPLIKIQGKTIIERVYERVHKSAQLTEIVVATDDVRIYNHVRKFGGHAIITRLDHPSGTSRCAEIIEAMSSFDLIVNIQGDEPLINPVQIDQLVEFMTSQPTISIGTLMRRIDRIEDLSNPAVAKVVCGHHDRVMYFSRSPIPFVRDLPINQWLEHGHFYRHIGMYAYRREVLKRIGILPQSDLERTEKLEQLNWLYHGYPIHAIETEFESLGIDTPEDLALLEKMLELSNVS
ncbi:MAG TPA: 3-deoxy-manno-octulosonate cytidylyltransferase [Saprospiraceae bacterium]|nr:3-deoxy-manno-octulosonate cytidylyltransferase [Saprospiraceae bacterium]